MPAVAESIARAGTSNETQATRSLAFGAVYSSLLFSPVEGYAQACLALATAVEPAYERISAPTILIAGAEDKTSPTATIDYLHTRISGSNVVTLQNVGHWHLLEDVEASARALVEFL
jgi:pimeloyl-ACP methyl ester carboxylesterase